MAYLIEKPLEVSKDHFWLKIRTDSARALPGQFVNIRPREGSAPLIRRPISVFNYSDNIIELIVQLAGEGTKLLCNRPVGEIDIIGPVGKPFSLPQNSRLLLVGGGVGNAPLYYLARELKKNGNDITYIYGARSVGYIFLEEKYRETADNFILMTDDGSKGDKGFATEAAATLPEPGKFDIVYTCGPHGMMETLTKIMAAAPRIEVSMENYFACGIGLCSGCVVKTSEGHKRACVEGPVMDGKLIVW